MIANYMNAMIENIFVLGHFDNLMDLQAAIRYVICMQLAFQILMA